MTARIGLEAHVELAVERKLFCGCASRFGDAPGTHVCPFCTGREGSPRLNGDAAALAVRAALALGCLVPPASSFVRKRNGSPYLPGGYQITQREEPIGVSGLYEGIPIERIQLEEDAARRTQGAPDWNRSGVALIEIVTPPALSSAGQARAFAESLRFFLRFLGVTQGRMEQGGMRMDANVSTPDGGYVEIKGLASFAAMEKAIRAQTDGRGSREGGTILHWREREGILVPARESYAYSMERAVDIPPVRIDDMTRLREREAARMTQSYFCERFLAAGVGEQDARRIVRHRGAAEFFARALEAGAAGAIAAGLLLGPVFSFLRTEEEREAWRCPITGSYLAALSLGVAAGDYPVEEARDALSLALRTGEEALPARREEKKDGALRRAALQAMEEMPEAVAAYRAGRERALSALIGAVRREGSWDARDIRALLLRLLSG